MSTLSRRPQAARALWGLSVAVLVIASCERPVEPNRSGRAIAVPATKSRDYTFTYPHIDKGPCYVWAPDNYPEPGTLTDIESSQGEPTTLSVCNVTVTMTAEPLGGGSDTLMPWYVLKATFSNPTTVFASPWRTGPFQSVPPGWLSFGRVVASFNTPLKGATVRFWCMASPPPNGYEVSAYDLDGLAMVTKPGCTTGDTISDVSISATGIYKLVAHGPSSNAGTYGWAEFWIVPDSNQSSGHMVIQNVNTNRWVGDTTRFDVTTTDHSSFTVSKWEWHLDSNVTPPPDFVEKINASSCRTSAFCSFTPGGSGILKVYGKVNKKADSGVKNVVISLPKFSVACSPQTVVRADPAGVTCTATGGFRTLSPTGWMFIPTDSAVGTLARSTNKTSKTWAGVMVTSGGVTVQGKINGITAASDTGKAIVADRTASQWNSRGDTLSIGDDSGHYECDSTRHYAATRSGWAGPRKCFGLYYFIPVVPPDTAAIKVARVAAGGPNENLFYVTSVTDSLEMHAQVLKDWRPDGNRYVMDSLTAATCADTTFKSPTATVTEVNLRCKNNSTYSTFYSNIWRHERCHAALAKRVFDSIPDPKAFVERVVRKDSSILRDEAVYGARGLNQSSVDVNHGSTWIDTLPKRHYDLWVFDVANMKWAAGFTDARDGIDTTGVC